MTALRIAVSLTIINLFFLLAVLGRASSLDAQAGGSVLRGQALELVDESGRIRSRLNVESNGEVVLRLLDEAGTIRVKLGAGRDGSGLVLLNDATELGVQILANANGSMLLLRSKAGQERVLTP